jgi:hypothetical protein
MGKNKPQGKKGQASGGITGRDQQGGTHRAVGYKAMRAQPGAKTFTPDPAIAADALPKKVDLRPHMTTVEDQQDTSSCVANAVAGSYEYWVKKATGKDFDVSRLFIYYNARWRNGDEDEDDGSVIQLAMEGLSRFGACSERIWPFEPHLVTERPNRSAYAEGSGYRVQDMVQVSPELEAWKRALAEGKPIVFGCTLFDSFDDCNKRGGVVPMPRPEEVIRAEHGGHSMCCVGYSDPEGIFIVRNSWGPDWGDRGYCYMPYNYLMNPKFNDGDSWVFIPSKSTPSPQDDWSDDDRPVTNGGRGVDFIINAFAVAAYSGVVEDLFAGERLEWNSLVAEDFNEYSEAVQLEQFDVLEEFDVNELLEEKYAEEAEEEEDPGDDDDEDEGEDEGEDEDDEEDEGEEDEEDDEEDDDEDDEEDEGEEDEEDDEEDDDEEDDDDEDDGEEDEEDDGDDGDDE